MSVITHITNHADLAEARLPEQYKGKAKLTALVRIAGTQAQVIEDILYDMISSGGIVNGHDSLLDQIGTIVGQPRDGMDDATYKVRLLTKVAENVSKGTPEVLIRIYKALMQADRVYYNPLYPASFTLTAIGGTPLGTIADIKAALNSSRIGGVSIEFALAPSVSFSFSDDPDPNGAGFGDSTDASMGGTLAQII